MDNELIAAIRHGDKQALSTLYLQYFDRLSHYGNRISSNKEVTEECIQELFLYISEFHERLGIMKNVKAYLFVSLRRRILEKVKIHRKNPERQFSIAEHTYIKFAENEILFAEENQFDKEETLVEALNNLPWRQREAIYLRYYNKLSTKEIAHIMGVANQTILNTLHQALRKLRRNKDLHRIG